MAQKVSYLVTSQEKFLQRDGSGCCNGDSPIPIGKKIAAILQKNPDSIFSSPQENIWPFPRDVTSEDIPPWEDLPQQNGNPWETLTSLLAQWARESQQS